MDEETRRVYLDIFLEESSNLINQFEDHAALLRTGSESAETDLALFRLVHTMKGNALAMDFEEIVSQCHRFEDLLQGKQNRAEHMSDQDIALFTAELQGGLEAIAAGSFAMAPPLADSEGGEQRSERSQTLRVPLDSVSRLAALTANAEAWLWPEYFSVEGGLDALTFARNLHGIAVDLCAVKLSATFHRIHQTVSDLERRLGKPGKLVTCGGELFVDRFTVEALTDPLNHVIRNAFDHGIEATDVRLERGKPPVGTIRIEAQQAAGQLRLVVSDDGGGIDLDRLCIKAVSGGRMTAEEAAGLTDEDAINLIFESGLSTAEEVSDISGRGVGMDIVKARIEGVGGTINVQTVIGQGSTIVITVPTSAEVEEAFICVADGTYIYLRHEDVVETFAPPKLMKETDRCDGKIKAGNIPIKVFKYAHKKWIDATDNNSWDDRFIVVLNSSAEPYAILVDQLVGRTRRLMTQGRRIEPLDVPASLGRAA